MVRADFVGVLTKIEWAEKHLGVLETEVRDYINSNPIELNPKPDADGLREDFYIRYVEPVPERFGLLLGDCIHNLRSALDHIAMSLAISNGVSPYNTSVSFPICKSPAKFFGEDQIGSFARSPQKGTGRYNVRRLKRDAQAFIEQMQPYNGGAEAWALLELQYLDNRDKHRGLLAHAFNQVMQFEITTPGVTLIYSPGGGRLEDGAYFASMHYAPDYSGVKVKPPFVARICVERSNRIGILFIPEFIMDAVVYQVRGIWTEAERRFGAWSELP